MGKKRQSKFFQKKTDFPGAKKTRFRAQKRQDSGHKIETFVLIYRVQKRNFQDRTIK